MDGGFFESFGSLDKTVAISRYKSVKRTQEKTAAIACSHLHQLEKKEPGSQDAFGNNNDDVSRYRRTSFSEVSQSPDSQALRRLSLDTKSDNQSSSFSFPLRNIQESSISASSGYDLVRKLSLQRTKYLTGSELIIPTCTRL
jgi:hypothetical protein